ncbi:MAG: ribonuclease P protein component [bacterium]|nr:ribonuclease P protein component [bacterium]
MLSKPHRLLFKKKGRRSPRGGKRYRSPFFDLVVSLEPKSSQGVNQQSVSKFGFIVSSRISKKAVIRNRVKRLLGEAVRQFLPKIKSGFGIIILTKPDIVGRDLKKIYEELEGLFQKASLLKS